jgi:hypothetical protein
LLSDESEVVMIAPQNEVSIAVQLAEHFWTEFKYRHDLIWQRIFRLTAAVVLISIIPYAQPIVAKLLGNWILVAPILATALAGFAYFVMQHELKLFERIATEYMWQQNKLLATEPEHKIGAPRPFGDFVKVYLIFLIGLSCVNGVIIGFVWIPAVISAAPEIFK